MKIAIIDNYDSFTYNLRHKVREVRADVDVLRNDKFKLDELSAYDKLILSPGPGIPSEAGLLLDTIKMYAESKPILGVCLGHQAIAEVFGGKLTNLDDVYHGVQTPVKLVPENKDYIFAGLPDRFLVGRYHSWVADRDSLPSCLETTALSDEGLVMALKHKQFDIHGIQFHPESVLTPEGFAIIANFVKRSTTKQ